MKEMTFEKAMEKLEKTVEELENGNLPLDELLKRYEEGVKLASFCQGKLNKAKARIEALVKNEDGLFEKTDFNGEEQ